MLVTRMQRIYGDIVVIFSICVDEDVKSSTDVSETRTDEMMDERRRYTYLAESQ